MPTDGYFAICEREAGGVNEVLAASPGAGLGMYAELGAVRAAERRPSAISKA